MTGIAISLNSFLPPSASGYWPDINVSRVTNAIDSNWPFQ